MKVMRSNRQKMFEGVVVGMKIDVKANTIELCVATERDTKYFIELLGRDVQAIKDIFQYDMIKGGKVYDYKIQPRR